MLNGLKIIDVDSHVMEPDDLWERFMDRRFAAFMPKSRRISPTWPYFAQLVQLARDAEVSELSMGMSGDFETAIAMGATLVRVGSALFGARG